MNAHPTRFGSSWWDRLAHMGVVILAASFLLYLTTVSQPDPELQLLQPDPAMSKDFVLWWSNAAFDYDSKSSTLNHSQAANWMTPGADRLFAAAFWRHDFRRPICSHTVHSVGKPRLISPTTVAVDIDVHCQKSSSAHKSKHWPFTIFVIRNTNGYRVTDFLFRISPEHSP